MTIPAVSSRRWLVPALAMALAPLALGCGEEAEIRSYEVAKDVPPDRMLGAIIPAGERAWFFKVAGPTTAMDKQADSIEAFFNSIRVKPDAEKPEWTIPEGWREEAGSGMRTATIWVPADGKPLELSVIPLPSQGTRGEILSNVNRWREQQMGLPAVDERGLVESTREAKVGDATMTIVDLRGKYSGGMTAPFAGGGPFSGAPGAPGNRPAAGGAQPGEGAQSTELPPGHPPIDLPPGHPPIDSDQGADDGN